jgi:hypothetical protein
MLKCKITKLSDKAWPLIVANIPWIVYGPTGAGKSSVIRHDLIPRIEREYGPTVLHDVRLSTKDIMDGTGMPVIVKEEMATYWTRPAFVPVDDGKMHVFLYDEFGHASVQLQQMCYSLILDRALGGYPLPKNNRIILASNTREDGGGDNKMLKPLQNRMGHFQVEIDSPGLIEKMKVWGWDSRLVAFLTLRPGEIHLVNQNDPSFSTPRSLEMLNDVLKALPVDVRAGVIEDSAQAIVGDGFTRQFMTFLINLGAQLPKFPDIVASPFIAKVPHDPHFQYVVGSMVARHISLQTVEKCSEYLARLMPDIRSMAAHSAMARDNELSQHPCLLRLIQT